MGTPQPPQTHPAETPPTRASPKPPAPRPAQSTPTPQTATSATSPSCPSPRTLETRQPAVNPSNPRISSSCHACHILSGAHHLNPHPRTPCPHRPRGVPSLRCHGRVPHPRWIGSMPTLTGFSIAPRKGKWRCARGRARSPIPFLAANMPSQSPYGVSPSH
jgi:hypothetical protein